MESHRFEADVRQILELVTHSLYSEREIFLRELVSNASDALDRARFEQLKRDDLRPVEGEPAIRVTVDEAAGTITVSDDGIGLTREEAVEHLGTIAESGTRAFSERLKEQAEGGGSAEGLIGRFGVGFYSAFMVADRVVVESLSALPGTEPIRWESDGGESFQLGPGERAHRGTDVVLHLREDAREFLDADRLREVIRKHSEFVTWPIFVDGERVNTEQALWARNPADLDEDAYKGFYRHLTGDWQDPLLWSHARIEGTPTYDALLYVPRKRPWELDRLDFKVGLKLYQRRVKILDHANELLPRWLRFVSGVVDSPDVELNLSREMLQNTPVIRKIKQQLTRRVLKRLRELSIQAPDDYALFWKEFGHILKEGITEVDGKDRDLLVGLLRFRTTRSADGELRSLAQVKSDLAEGQDAIWYLTSIDKERIAEAPVLEAFKKKGWEVLLMDDPVDEWVVMHLPEYQDTPLRSVMRGELPAPADDDPVAAEARKQAEPLVAWLRDLLKDVVADVRTSGRLTESPSVLVDQDGGMGSNMERILRAANQEIPTSKRVLEVNPEHPMVRTLARLNAEGHTGLEPFARLLLDHAAIAEGRLDDPKGFASRLQALMERAAAALAGQDEGGAPEPDPSAEGDGGASAETPDAEDGPRAEEA